MSKSRVGKTRCPKCGKYRWQCGLGHCGELFPNGESVVACFECFESTPSNLMVEWGLAQKKNQQK